MTVFFHYKADKQPDRSQIRLRVSSQAAPNRRRCQRRHKLTRRDSTPNRIEPTFEEDVPHLHRGIRPSRVEILVDSYKRFKLIKEISFYMSEKTRNIKLTFNIKNRKSKKNIFLLELEHRVLPHLVLEEL